MRVKIRWYDGFLLILLSYLFIFQILAIWPFTIDDMYISLRYARNWVAGDGLLWNFNDLPVEGYSNFSFVLLGALSLFLKLDPVVTLKLAGLAGLFFTCVFIYLISRFWFDARIALIPCIALLFYKGQIIWAISGLETSVYQALISGSVYFAFRGLGYLFYPKHRGPLKHLYFFMAGVFISVAGFTRPEAPALMVLFLLLILWDAPCRNLRDYGYLTLSYIAPIGMFYLPYFLWRWHYYGYLFPNAVYCKGFINEWFKLDAAYLKLTLLWIILSIPAVINAKDKRHYFLWLPSLVYLLMLMNSDPIVAFYNRLFLPVFVLLLPLSLQGLGILIRNYVPHPGKMYPIYIFGMSFLIIALFIPKFTLAEYRYFTKGPIEGEHLRNKVIQWLNATLHSDDKVVLADAGMIPYHSKVQIIDSYCLNNEAMAHDSHRERYERFCNEILQKNPTAVILTSLVEADKTTYSPSDLCLKQLLKHNNDYKLITVFSAADKDSSYRYELFANF
ncbi:MAG TPA: protein LphB [Legionella sp.]|nr:protein LphB [Legionella sp.]